MTWTLRLLSVAVMSLLLLAVGCAQAPDRRAQAKELEAAIKSMPGVRSSAVNYENTFERGPTLSASVDIPAADRKQIIDLVAKINETRREDFVKFDQSFEFAVTGVPFVNVARGATLNPASIAEDAERLRNLAPRIAAGEIRYDRDDKTSSLSLQDLRTATSETLTAVRDFLRDPAVTVDIRRAYDSGMPEIPLWKVTFPLSSEQQNAIDRQVAAMPVDFITSVRAGPGAVITGLNVFLRSSATAYDDLVSIIRTTGAGPHQPLWLNYGSKKVQGGLDGIVIVGGCGYPNTSAEIDPAKNLTAPELELQQRLRTEFDTCPR